METQTSIPITQTLSGEILCVLKIRLGKNKRSKNKCGVDEVSQVTCHSLITGTNQIHALSDLMGGEMTQDLRVLTALPGDLPEFSSYQ